MTSSVMDGDPANIDRSTQDLLESSLQLSNALTHGEAESGPSIFQSAATEPLQGLTVSCNFYAMADIVSGGRKAQAYKDQKTHFVIMYRITQQNGRVLLANQCFVLDDLGRKQTPYQLHLHHHRLKVPRCVIDVSTFEHHFC
jgi:hypothetical protein